MKPIRTRIAPSPTGDPHVGTAYIGLMNSLFAEQNKGEFILRIEDTDQERSTPESEKAILDALTWFGLSWSEGPDVGGPHAPYRQSERKHIYQAHCDMLVEKGHAFPCFCSQDRLNTLRQDQQKAGKATQYDGKCLSLTPEEIQEKKNSGEPYVIRMKIPSQGTCTFEDKKRGQISIDWHTVDMQVLMKSDGMPTYHLANVVDDHLMEITHVIRGEEWISSTPKHILLYTYFGWEAPEFCHLPLLRNPDRSKLSKRKSPTGILYFKKMGYLPEALTAQLGSYALSLKEGEDDLLTIEEIQEKFSLDNISLGGPVFDTAKLDNLNSRWIREKLTPEGLLSTLIKWTDIDDLKNAVELAQTRITKLSDFWPLAGFLWAGNIHPKLDGSDKTKEILTTVLTDMETIKTWDKPSIDSLLRATAEKHSVKLKDIVKPLYVVMTGNSQSLPLFESMVLLGKDMVRDRLRKGIAAKTP